MATGLAYVGQINQLFPIENADRIVSAEVVCGDGGKWRGVVGKDEFCVGDPCIVYLQDAIVQPSEQLAFLEKCQWRVRMQRFRGSPSECVVTRGGDAGDIGRDLTEALGVQKYEKALPPHMNGVVVGQFPAGIPKTDEPNFQSARKLVEALRGQSWYATVKMDGTSTTAYRRGDHFGVCSRNLELAEYAKNAQWSIALRYDLKSKLPDGIALQFELCGPGVQKNPAGFKQLEAFAFNAWSINQGKYLDRGELESLCQNIGFPVTEINAWGPSFYFDDDELRSVAEGEYQNGKPREGIVIRPATEQWVGHQRLSFKVINLKYGN
jgi:RNA ligase (TIGR02306 family)